jgi:CheY-like chemotaxis protein/signal transduction histidine kinase
MKYQQLWTARRLVITLSLLLLIVMSLAGRWLPTDSARFADISFICSHFICWEALVVTGLVVGSGTKFAFSASRVFLIALLFGRAYFMQPTLAGLEASVALVSVVHVDLVIVATVGILCFSMRETLVWNAAALMWAILLSVLNTTLWIDTALPFVFQQAVQSFLCVKLGKRHAMLEKQLAELREHSRVLIRAKAQFCAAMSHEIRTPLNGLVGLTDALLETWSLNEGQRQCVEGIQSCARVVLALSTRALQYTRYSAMNAMPTAGAFPSAGVNRSCVFSLRAVLDDAARAISSAAAVRHVSMYWSVAPDVTDTYRGNSQHVLELVLKMLDYSLGRVRDHTGRVVMRVQIASSSSPADCIDTVSLELTVRDNGSPLSADQTSFGARPPLSLSIHDAPVLLATGADFALATAGVVAKWLGGALEVYHDAPDEHCLPGKLPAVLLATIVLVSASLDDTGPVDSVSTLPVSPVLVFPSMSSTMSSPQGQFEQKLSGVHVSLVCDFAEVLSAFRDTLLSSGAVIPYELVLPPPPVTKHHRQVLSDIFSGQRLLHADRILLLSAGADLLLESLPSVVVGAQAAPRTAVILFVPPDRVSEFEREVERIMASAGSARSGPVVTVVTASVSSQTLMRLVHNARQRMLATQELWAPTAVPLVSIDPPVGTDPSLEASGSRLDHGFGSLALEPLSAPASARRFSIASGISALASDAAAASDTDQSTLPSVPFASDRRALVVDDNRLNVMVLCRLLRKLGMESDVACNGDEALRYIRQDSAFERPGTSYAVVLMDLHMPVMDGLEATRQLRQFEQEHDEVRVPVVAVTASVADGCEQACTAAGMDGFLSKPVSLRALHRALTELKL